MYIFYLHYMYKLCPCLWSVINAYRFVRRVTKCGDIQWVRQEVNSEGK